ncbi:hypothetical protein QL093DRAFT_2181565, partial [Fusarium oxysporum]
MNKLSGPFCLLLLLVAPEHFSIAFIIHYMFPRVCYRPTGEQTEIFNIELTIAPCPVHVALGEKKPKLEARSDCLFRH